MGGRDSSSHRQTERNQRKTEERMERYLGKAALLATWDKAPDDLQVKEHDYLLGLKKTVRQERNYVLHRNDPNAKI